VTLAFDLHPLAESELDAAVDLLEVERPGTGFDLADAVEEYHADLQASRVSAGRARPHPRKACAPIIALALHRLQPRQARRNPRFGHRAPEAAAVLLVGRTIARSDSPASRNTLTK
jgi:hypothetical protein